MTGRPTLRSVSLDAPEVAPSRARNDAPADASRELRGSFLRLAERFRPHEARGVEARWTIVIADEATYTVHVRDGHCFVSPGSDPDADATLVTDADTWLGLVSGRQDGVKAFTGGHLQVHGDLNLALRLESLFRPGPEAARFIRTVRIDARGHELEALVAGRGTPVLLLHGLAANKVSFVPTLDDLAARYEVHALDLPGFGKSDKPLPTGGRYSMRWMADVVHGYLRAQGIRQAYVIGNSMGGRIGVELALRHPRRVLGVVGLMPAVAFDEYQWLGPALRLLQGQWLGLAPFPLSRDAIEDSIRSMFHDPSRIPAQNIEAAAEEFLRNIGDRRHRLAILACARQLGAERASGRRSFWCRIEQLRQPSYWVFGDRDPLVSWRYCERVGDRLPNARCEVWPDLGHVPQFEDPERTHAKVGGFLDELEAARA